MENSKTNPEIITGKNKKYNPKFIENWPLKDKFEYKNCIACFYVLRLENNLLLRRYVNAEYFEEIKKENMVDYKFGKYAPNGFFILYAEKEDVDEIIEDIKASEYFLE